MQNVKIDKKGEKVEFKLYNLRQMDQSFERASARGGSSQIQPKGGKKGSRASSKRDAKSV